jgi:hypothetical protein
MLTEMLVSQLSNLTKRNDVAQMITGEIKPHAFYADTFRSEEEMVVSASSQQSSHSLGLSNC